jgi:phage repressor protein C with HTH and peptisase S24 domain
MDAINQRIALFIDEVNMNPNRFAKEVGYKRPDNIYNVYTGRTKPSWEMLEAIAARFTDLNMNWLIRGTGTMLEPQPNEEDKNSAGEATAGGQAGKQPAGEEEQGGVVTVDRMGNDTILAVPLHAQEGYRDKYGDTHYLKGLSSFVLPYFTEGNYRAFEMEGDSMEPAIRHGDYVIGSYLYNRRHLKPGNAYVIVTAEGIAVRRVVGGVKEQNVQLTADNPYYPSYEQPLAEIKEVWAVKGVLTAHLPASRPTGQDHLLPVIEALGKNTLLTQKLIAALDKVSQE